MHFPSRFSDRWSSSVRVQDVEQGISAQFHSHIVTRSLVYYYGNIDIIISNSILPPTVLLTCVGHLVYSACMHVCT